MKRILAVLLASAITLVPSLGFAKNRVGGVNATSEAEHDSTAQGVGAKRSKLVNAAGSEVGTAASPLFTSPATAPAVQPVSDNAGSLTTDTPQLPAALNGDGSLKVGGPVTAAQLPTALVGDGLKVTIRNATGAAGGAPTFGTAGVIRDLAVNVNGADSKTLTIGTWKICAKVETLYMCAATACDYTTADAVLPLDPGACITRYFAGSVTIYFDSASGAAQFAAEPLVF